MTSSSSDGPLVLRAGDTLLDHLDALVVRDHPRTSQAEAVAQRLAPMLRRASWTIPADAWLPGAPMDETLDLGALIGVEGTLSRWRARPPVRLDLALGALWLHHGDRALERVTDAVTQDRVTTRRLIWLDEGDGTRRLFWWDGRNGMLLAFGEEPPGAITLGYDGALDSAVARAEWRLAEKRGAPRDAVPLAVRQSLAAVDRPVLLAPAPTVLELPVDQLAADELSVVLGVFGLGFEIVDGHVQRLGHLGDGVTFAVEAVVDGSVRRLLSRHVTDQEGWVEERVDLAELRGRSLTLRLVTEGGPAGDTLGDYAMWSDLRLRGGVTVPNTRPHVILIDVDTLRADRLGCYGYERDTSPRLDAWAAREAAVYTDATSVNNWTLPSTASMLTGLTVAQHGVRHFPQALGPEAVPLAEHLRAAGWETWASVDSGFVAPTFGFARGFDLYDFRREPPARAEKAGWRAELARLRERRSERPVFYFLHTYMVHGPYRDDRRFVQDPDYGGVFAHGDQLELVKRQRAGELDVDVADARFLSDLYDAGVRRMDDMVMDFLQGLPDVFGDEPYMVVLTSDHGEELLDHGSLGHGHSLHGELLEVPLIIRYPGRHPRRDPGGSPGRDPEGGLRGRFDEPVSLLDIVPTILDVVGLPIPDGLPGRPLGAGAEERHVRVAHHGSSAWAVDFDGWKLLVGEIEAFGRTHSLGQLFDLRGDPGETADVADSRSDRARQLADMLIEHQARFGPITGGESAGHVDERLRDELAALGYLGDDG